MRTAADRNGARPFGCFWPFSAVPDPCPEVARCGRQDRQARRWPGPVKVIWSGEEDIQHDMYRPHYFDRLSAELDAEIPDFRAAQCTPAVSTDLHPEGGWISAAARHWDMASKKPRMSASSTQFTHFLSSTRQRVLAFPYVRSFVSPRWSMTPGEFGLDWSKSSSRRRQIVTGRACAGGRFQRRVRRRRSMRRCPRADAG
jgi:hypothetical protein